MLMRMKKCCYDVVGVGGLGSAVPFEKERHAGELALALAWGLQSPVGNGCFDASLQHMKTDKQTNTSRQWREHTKVWGRKRG